MRFVAHSIITAIFLTMAGAAVAGPFEDGEAAYQRNDYATALRLWLPLAEKGNARAEIELGAMSDKGLAVPQDFAEAVMWYQRAADNGNADAQYELGRMYYEGRSVPELARDFAKAAMWYRKAADKGLFIAQFTLGELYERGQGVPQDYVKAHMWFNLSASGAACGDPFCEYDLRDAVNARDDVAAKMTPSQIAEAQRLVRGWKPER